MGWCGGTDGWGVPGASCAAEPGDAIVVEEAGVTSKTGSGVESAGDVAGEVADDAGGEAAVGDAAGEAGSAEAWGGMTTVSTGTATVPWRDAEEEVGAAGRIRARAGTGRPPGSTMSSSGSGTGSSAGVDIDADRKGNCASSNTTWREVMTLRVLGL